MDGIFHHVASGDGIESVIPTPGKVGNSAVLRLTPWEVGRFWGKYRYWGEAFGGLSLSAVVASELDTVNWAGLYVIMAIELSGMIVL